MSSRLKYAIEYCAAAPSEESIDLSSRAVTKPFMAPLFHESCCGSQSWLVDGSICALELCVSAWNGKRNPAGLSGSACLKTPGIAREANSLTKFSILHDKAPTR